MRVQSDCEDTTRKVRDRLKEQDDKILETDKRFEEPGIKAIEYSRPSSDLVPLDEESDPLDEST
jgi:hypothetical protein